jgi:hypothetical protein
MADINATILISGISGFTEFMISTELTGEALHHRGLKRYTEYGILYLK